MGEVFYRQTEGTSRGSSPRWTSINSYIFLYVSVIIIVLWFSFGANRVRKMGGGVANN